MEMNYPSVLGPLVFQMEMGDFAHFEPLWRFLRTVGCAPDFFIPPQQIVAARDQMNSLWPEIHRTPQYFHPDDDPFWKMRDLLERAAANGEAIVTMCD